MLGNNVRTCQDIVTVCAFFQVALQSGKTHAGRILLHLAGVNEAPEATPSEQEGHPFT